MPAVAIENGYLPIGGSTTLSWPPTDAGGGDAPITGATVAYKVFTSDQWEVEKASPGTGVTVLNGTLTESPAGTYSATVAVPTSVVEGMYVVEVTLTAAGLTDTRAGMCPARYRTSAGS